MEPGPLQLRAHLVRAAVAGVWTAACVAVFVATVPRGDLPLSTASLLGAIIGGWLLPTQWLTLLGVAGVLGAAIGFIGFAHEVGTPTGVAAAVTAIGVVAAAVPATVWWRRVAFRRRLYREGTRAVGRVIRADGDHGSQDTHVTVRHGVEYTTPDGVTRIVDGKSEFSIVDKPAVDDSVEVYYLAAEPNTAVVVFASRRRQRL